MRKFEEFFRVLTAVRSLVRNGNGKTFKGIIGDSTVNNRTLTVNQVVRIFNKGRHKQTANEITAVYNLLKKDILSERKSRGVKRTDAIDIAELTETYRNLVMTKKRYRQNIGQVLSKVGTDGR